MTDHYQQVNWTTQPTQTPFEAAKSVAEPQSQSSLKLPVFLFIATVISTIWAGCLQQGINLFTHPWLFYRGLPFSLTLLLILGVHESGHYFMCKMHGIPSTVPYFIPMPNFLGTMGAFIKIKGSISSKRALLDIGMAGPLAGFVIALPAIILGYSLSGAPQPVFFQEGLVTGHSILTRTLEWFFWGHIPSGYMVDMHPIAFAGYIGLFVTAMNLLPVGQLDGSHVVSALFGVKQWQIAKITLGLLILFGVVWSGWWMWAALLLFFGLKHPVIRHDARSLGPVRRILAWTTIAIFFLTFVPVPFSFVSFGL